MDRSKRHRKLNLNAPIMSTRRFGSVFADTSSSSLGGTFQNTSQRVPFSWEKEPGKPKDCSKLPPCHRWFPRKESANQPYVGNGYDDRDDIDNKDDLFSDAMDDVFSLSEALDIVQRKSEKAHSDNNEGLKLKLAECSGYQSPTYLINRFLPDATALAASSSALNFHNDFEENICNTCSYPECYLSESGRHSHSYAYASGSSSTSPKGCGLEVLFPWRNMKHKFCSIESPVLPCSATTNLQKHQQRNLRESKRKKHQSSGYIPCTNVKKDV